MVMSHEWILLEYNEYNKYFYDTQSIRCDSQKYCSVRIKLIYTEKDRKSYLDELTKQNLSVHGYDSLRASEVQSKYNCAEKTATLTQIIDYDD